MSLLDRINEILFYDPLTGVFIWKKTHSARACAGDEAGSISDQGYRLICIDGVKHRAHRLAWLIMHQEDAPEFLDHINGDRLDNRIDNLRAGTKQQNAFNSRGKKRGLKGATFAKCTGKWRAQIMRDGRNYYLGEFDTEQQAHEAYCQAAPRYHGDFARAA